MMAVKDLFAAIVFPRQRPSHSLQLSVERLALVREAVGQEERETTFARHFGTVSLIVRD